MRNSSKDLSKKILGQHGEKLALDHLKKQGYKLVEKNYRTPYGEADLIVRRDELVFVEVKTRSSDLFGTPAESVDHRKQEKYRRIAQFWFLSHEEEPFRFDVIEIQDEKINQIEGGF